MRKGSYKYIYETYLSFELLHESRSNIILGHDIKSVWIDRRCRGGPLQLQEGNDTVYLAFVRSVREGATLGCQSTRCHPFGILLFLCNREAENLIIIFIR